MELTLSVIGAVVAGVILLVIEYRTRWFARGLGAGAARSSSKERNGLALRAFVDELILLGNDPAITPDNVEIVRKIFLAQVHEAINKQLVRKLSFDDQIALDKLLKKNATEAELDKFFATHIKDLEAEVTQALMDFRTAYLLGKVVIKHNKS